MESDSVVITSAFVGMGSTIGGSLATKSSLPPNRMIIGGFFAFMGCGLIAEFSDEVGAGLAVLIAGTMFIMYGLPAINSVLNTNKVKPMPVNLQRNVPKGAPPTAFQ